MITLRFPDKDPAAQENYLIDFTNELAARSPVTIAAVSWSVIAIPGDLAPLVVVAHVEPVDNSSSTVALSGGTLGNTYVVRCSITYSDGETEPVSFYLAIGYT